MARYIYNAKHEQVAPAPVSNRQGKADAVLESDYTPEEIARWMFSLPLDAALKHANPIGVTQ